MSTRMQNRRGTAAQWISLNDGDGPILAAGEIGYETDTNKFKIGDGINHWVDLTYFLDADTAYGAISGLIDGAPDLLNTLNELAAAIGDDPAFMTTVATNLSNHQSDTTNIHGIADTAELATKEFAASLLTGATKTNIVITGDKNGLTITAENGVADSTTDNLTEGSTNKYFTDERAQDAVGNAVGTGLTYTDATGEIKVTPLTYDAYGTASQALIDANAYTDTEIAAIDALPAQGGNNGKFLTTDGAAASWATVDLSAKQDVVSGVSSTEIGYLDGVTSSIQTQIDSKLSTSTASSTYQPLVSGVSNTEIGYLDGVTSAIQTQIDAKAPTNSPTFTGTVAGITKSMVGLGSVDNTADADKPVSSATQTALDAKLSKSGGTMTGAITLSGAPTSDLHATTKLYVDNVTAGINFHEAVHVATTTNLSADYNNGTNGVGATLTASANGDWPTIDGHSSFTQYDRVLVKSQTDSKQNGIYILSDLGSGSSKWILTRATDADNNPAGEMKNGDFVLVLNGTTNASYGFVNNSGTNPIVIGTDNITYTAFNAAKTIAAGNGLQEATPGILSIDTSITATLANPTFTGTVTLPNSTVTNAMLAGSIANAKLVNSAITVNSTSISLGDSKTFNTPALTWGEVKNGGKALVIA